MIQRQDIRPHELVLRIPGSRPSASVLGKRLPSGFDLDGNCLHDGNHWVEFQSVKADEMFPFVFSLACKLEPTRSERRKVEAYRMNAVLLGPAGSVEAARFMMRCAAAVLQAGGAGVFIDNSAIAHGAKDWFKMTDAAVGEFEPLISAFVNAVGSDSEVYSVGGHVLGNPDVMIPRSKTSDRDRDLRTIFQLHLAALRGRPFRDRDLFEGPRRVRLHHRSARRFPARLPMHNVFGEWRLEDAD